MYVAAAGIHTIQNVQLISKMAQLSKPQNIVLELWDERFNKNYDPIMKDPKYEVIMSHFQKILDNEEKANQLSEKSSLLEMDDLEYLIAIDFCSFRSPNCRSVLGDRLQSITKKRMKAKERLSELKTIDTPQFKSEGQDKTSTSKSQNEEISKLHDVLREDLDDSPMSSTSGAGDFDFKSVTSSILQKESKTKEEIYQEVYIDEINQELIKNINKWEGNIINLIIQKERVSAFETMWKNTFEEHYKDLDRKEKLKKIEEKHLNKAKAENSSS